MISTVGAFDLDAAQRVVVQNLLGEVPDRGDLRRLEERLGEVDDDGADHLEDAVDDRGDEAPTSRRKRADVAVDDRDVAVDAVGRPRTRPTPPSMSRLIRARVRSCAVELLGDEGEDLAEDVDRFEHRADRRAERSVREQRLDQLGGVTETGSSLSGSTPVTYVSSV